MTDVDDSIVPSVSFTRASLQGYLVSLFGVLILVENVLSALADGTSLPEIGGIALGLFAIGGSVLASFRPERLPRGTEPAPPSLYGLAGVTTVAFGIAIASLLS